MAKILGKLLFSSAVLAAFWGVTAPYTIAADLAPSPQDPHGLEAFVKGLTGDLNPEIDENILREGFTTKLRLLDRYTNKIDILTIENQGGLVFEDHFLISVASCIPEQQNIPGNSAAFITVRNRAGSILFNGWLLRLFPGASVFEHPRYGLFLKGCEATN